MSTYECLDQSDYSVCYNNATGLVSVKINDSVLKNINSSKNNLLTESYNTNYTLGGALGEDICSGSGISVTGIEPFPRSFNDGTGKISKTNICVQWEAPEDTSTYPYTQFVINGGTPVYVKNSSSKVRWSASNTGASADNDWNGTLAYCTDNSGSGLQTVANWSWKADSDIATIANVTVRANNQTENTGLHVEWNAPSTTDCDGKNIFVDLEGSLIKNDCSSHFWNSNNANNATYVGSVCIVTDDGNGAITHGPITTWTFVRPA